MSKRRKGHAEAVLMERNGGEDLKSILRRRNGKALAMHHPVTEPDKKREAKKTGRYYEDS